MKPIQCLRENVDLDLLLELRERLIREREDIESASERYLLVANATRLSILWLMQQSPKRELCPCDLADILGITVPGVSQQLQRLRRGGLVRNRREGKTIFYSLTNAGKEALFSALPPRPAGS